MVYILFETLTEFNLKIYFFSIGIVTFFVTYTSSCNKYLKFKLNISGK